MESKKKFPLLSGKPDIEEGRRSDTDDIDDPPV